MACPDKFYVGGSSKASIEGVDLGLNAPWEATEEGEPVEVTTTDDFDEVNNVMKKNFRSYSSRLTGSLNFNWKKGTNPYTSMRAGSLVSLQLFMPDGHSFTLPCALIERFSAMPTAFADVWKISVSFSSAGNYEYN